MAERTTPRCAAAHDHDSRVVIPSFLLDEFYFRPSRRGEPEIFGDSQKSKGVQTHLFTSGFA